MSASKKRLTIGDMECGYDMSDPSIWTHVVGVCVMSLSMLFSYAALMENGAYTAIIGFIFGFGFLLLVYGHELDRVYIHFGNKIKFGADAYDPERTDHDTGYREIEDDDERF